jgi:signal transduction histidine kinase
MISQLQKEKESQGVLEQIILGVAHELNNPNAFVRMNTVNIKKMFRLLTPCFEEYEKNNPDMKFGPYTLPELKSKIYQHLESTLEATLRLIAISDKLKQCTITSLSESANVSLKEIIEETINSHNFILKNYPPVNFEVEENEPFGISGYRLQLEQAISTLITNACYAINAQFGENVKTLGNLRISLFKKNEMSIITVEDNGTGMDKETLSKAFTPFFTTKPHGIGDGLGLPICRSIVNRHGGSIEIETEPGKGTKVVIKLPVKQ